MVFSVTQASFYYIKMKKMIYIFKIDAILQGQLAPPPTFPPLLNKPVKLETDEAVLNKSMELRNYFR